MSSTKATAMSTRSPTIKRILREAAEISNSPSRDYSAHPLETDLFEWHFTLRGPPNSVYSEGVYHGRIVLPPTYPLRPPMFRFTTPNGRFEANREICLSISGHHEETWQPAWGVRTALVAFMETEARGQLGGLETTDDVRQQLAKESGAWTCTTCAKSNAEIIKDCEERCQDADAAASDVPVPQELKMVWKDEMKPEGLEAEHKVAANAAEDSELAEGFVQTSPLPPVPASQRPDAPLPQPYQRPIREATQNSAPAQQPGLYPSAAQHQTTEEAVPLWIDRAIVVLVVLLVALLIKVLFGL
ncbi:ubiquitin-conjugating enzyme E2 6 [Cordyceps fumosorosea ARSEF 2679]|uniref:Ubiquitin-conjugating enzyme E2 6 n=1 Tax=Cordyceps fumosorosea (strain ARSEF 2679) TaxID=1081104 RepID=A0A167YE44_CORFA|nr:ubiquitin-conjugating enzyme E2 6 [Cordyceps fumosorosea ARSEF 2679]OAA66228.1 ubiquitin-conjugating enzyme E2 6 [Cordyceps fumosorosea ARSEF 2679]